MAKFTDSTSAKHPSRQQKPLQVVSVALLTHVNDHASWREIVEGWPDSYSWSVTSVDGDIVKNVVKYTARGANRTDVERRLTLQHIIIDVQTEKL